MRVLVVPAVATPTTAGSLQFEHLVPTDETLGRDRRPTSTSAGPSAPGCVVEPPVYQGVTVVARLRRPAPVDGPGCRAAALTALYRYFNPLRGGPDGTGWPFGRPVQCRRGVRRAAAAARHRAGRGGPPVRRRPGHRQPGEQVSRIDLGRTPWCSRSSHQIRVMEVTDGVASRAPSTAWPRRHPLGSCCRRCTRTTSSSSGSPAASTSCSRRCWPRSTRCPATSTRGLAPPDFLDWLAGWVGVALDEGWPESRQRRFVADAVELYSWRGTRRGVVGLVAAYPSIEPEVVEDGGAAWSAAPGGDPPGRDGGRVEVVVHVPEPDAVDLTRLEAIVAAAAPAHLVTTVRVERAAPDSPVVGAPPPRQAKARPRPSTERPEP